MLQDILNLLLKLKIDIESNNWFTTKNENQV